MARPKPTALKMIDGNRGKRPLPANEPIYELADIKPPANLSAASKAEWQRLAPMLQTQRVLTEADLKIFGHYCEAVGNLAELKQIEQKATETDPRFFGQVSGMRKRLNRASAVVHRHAPVERGFDQVCLRARADAKQPDEGFIRPETGRGNRRGKKIWFRLT